jgi:cobalt/nickel transport protein
MAFCGSAYAHFGMLIPEKSVITPDKKSAEIQLSFSHPFEMHGMNLVKPKKFSVFFNDKETNLLPALKKNKVMNHDSFKAEYKFKRPGMYTFFMEPTPYPEPAEDNYIIHYTKTVVSAFNEGEDWNTPLGVKTEIVPLTRPWGNYAGNVFQGIVLLDGKPAPFTRVEVEYYNKDNKFVAPYECMNTQEVLCDENGVFTFACPKAGWWGFAGLNDADYKIKGKDVELGAVLWIEMVPYKNK